MQTSEMFTKLREKVLKKTSTPVRKDHRRISISSSSVSSIASQNEDRLQNVIETENEINDDFDPLKDNKICSESAVSNITMMCSPSGNPYENNQSKINSVSRPNVNRSTFSLEEDEKIINFFKAEKALMKLMFHSRIYKIMKEMCSFDRTWDDLRSRFLGDILPNLHKYKCLSIGELVDMYNTINMELPEELESTIYNVFKSKNIAIRNTTNEISIQKSENLNLIKMGNYIGFNLNDNFHVIIPSGDRASYEQDSELKQYNLQSENVHFVENDEYLNYIKLQKLHEQLDMEFSGVLDMFMDRNALSGHGTDNAPTSSSQQSKSCEGASVPLVPTSGPDEPEAVSEQSEEMYTCEGPQLDVTSSRNGNMDGAASNTQYFDCDTSNELNIFVRNDNSQKVFVKNIKKLTYGASEPFSGNNSGISEKEDKTEQDRNYTLNVKLKARESYKCNLRSGQKRKNSS